MKVAIVGTGYVGLSLAILLSQKYEVYALDIDQEKVDKINKKISPIKDIDIENYLRKADLKLVASTSQKDSFFQADYIIIATPSNYDVLTGDFDTSIVEKAISDTLQYNNNAFIIIKSTIPIGFTNRMREKYNTNKIIYSPEFLRETKALYDNLYPSRIVVGDNSPEAVVFGHMLLDCSKKNSSDLDIILMDSKEAESVKLFSNTYLAMRISFFNELDSFCEVNELSSIKVIRGVSSDPRIGDYYNNPSFGYGGYCLPKDTKQLLTNYENVPNNIIEAVVESNKTRKEFIVNSILKNSPKVVGIYRLVMKQGSDNYRESAVFDIIQNLQEKKIKILIFEPSCQENEINGIIIVKALNLFISKSDVIIANRMSKELDCVKNKVYTRDVFNEN